MRTYLRDRTPGGCYFFTVNLADRQRHTLVEHIDALRDAFRRTLAQHPVRVDAIVVLPDHLHCLWQLPPGDAAYPLRWRSIKARFAEQVTDDVSPNASRLRKGERGVWQRRYWEHRIRDDADYARHLNYIHYNPVKHGHVAMARDWPYSSFRRWVARGMYAEDWGAAPTHPPP
jgi:putative transposase